MATAKVAWFANSKDQLDVVLLEVCEELQLARTRYDLAVGAIRHGQPVAREGRQSFSISLSENFSARLHGARHDVQACRPATWKTPGCL